MKDITKVKFVPSNFPVGLAWVTVLLMTAAFAIFIFLGPEIHSEAEDAPTVLGNIHSIVSVFFILGSLLLPINKREKSIRLLIFLIGMAMMLIKIVLGIFVVGILNESLIGTIILLLISAAVVAIYYNKLRILFSK